ncbi:MAG TPA: YetF domain-containing protein [Sphingomonas sp.]|nr:YetF domain-containing protein [Sphingomonas sp.]
MELLRQLIGPDEGASALQLCFRVLPLLAFGIVCVRIAGRRTFAHFSPLDIVVALIVGSNISRVMTGKAPFFPVLAATLALVTLHRLLAYAAMRWDWVAALVKSRPIRVIENGVIDKKAMRRANLSDQDLAEGIRSEQVDDPAQVKLATLESSGKLSVVRKQPR